MFPGNKKMVNRPKMYMCYICGREYGSTSLKIHIPQCKEKFIKQQALLEPHLRRPLPQPPKAIPKGKTVAKMSAKEHAEFNQAAFDSFNDKALVPCSTCGRTFFPERLVKHQKSCSGPRKTNKPLRNPSTLKSKTASPSTLDAYPRQKSPSKRKKSPSSSLSSSLSSTGEKSPMSSRVFQPESPSMPLLRPSPSSNKRLKDVEFSVEGNVPIRIREYKEFCMLELIKGLRCHVTGEGPDSMGYYVFTGKYQDQEDEEETGKTIATSPFWPEGDFSFKIRFAARKYNALPLNQIQKDTQDGVLTLFFPKSEEVNSTKVDF